MSLRKVEERDYHIKETLAALNTHTPTPTLLIPWWFYSNDITDAVVIGRLIVALTVFACECIVISLIGSITMSPEEVVISEKQSQKMRIGVCVRFILYAVMYI